MLTTIDLLLGNEKINEKLVGKKKGRGRPRKITPPQGVYVYNKADIKSDWKQLTPQVKYQIKQRFSKLGILEPTAGMVWKIYKISKEFGLTYSQTFDVLN